MYFKISNQPHKLFLFAEETKHFSLMIWYRYNALFCANEIFVFFYDGSSIFQFLYFVGFLVQFFHFTGIIVNQGINQLFFYFVFIKSFCLFGVLRTSPQLKTKNNRHTINLKHPLQTKNVTPLSTERILFYMIKRCKSALSETFLQNCFSDQPYQ